MGFVFWVLWVMVRMGFGVVLCSMLMVLVCVKSMAMSHFVVVSSFMMVARFVGFVSLFVVMSSCCMVLGSVVMVVVMVFHRFLQSFDCVSND
jgi:hypothetical protein